MYFNEWLIPLSSSLSNYGEAKFDRVAAIRIDTHYHYVYVCTFMRKFCKKLPFLKTPIYQCTNYLEERVSGFRWNLPSIAYHVYTCAKLKVVT